MMKFLKWTLKKILTTQQIEKVSALKRAFVFNIVARLNSGNLHKLAAIYGTDKARVHAYIQHYIEHFGKLRTRKLKILEIGVGGYADPKKGGASLRMWERYFPKGFVYSFDIYDKSALQEGRIRIFRGSQADELFLKNICAKTGPLDIIIDDGSHIVDHVLLSFKTLFPFLREGGVYVVEDMQTSYWPKFGGNSEDLNDRSTSMNFFKGLVDGINYREFLKPNYVPSGFDRNIVSIHFYHNLVFIYKGRNEEPSNMVENGKFK